MERLFCAEAVERYVFLHDLRRIAAAADFLRLRLLRCRLRSSGTLFRGFLFSGRLSRFFRQRISGMRHARHCGLQRRAFARRRNNVSAVLRTDRVFANRDDAARIEFDQKRKAALNAFFSEHPHPDAVLRGILCDAQALNFLGPGNALPLIGRRRRHPNKQGRNRQVDASISSTALSGSPGRLSTVSAPSDTAAADAEAAAKAKERRRAADLRANMTDIGRAKNAGYRPGAAHRPALYRYAGNDSARGFRAEISRSRYEGVKYPSLRGAAPFFRPCSIAQASRSECSCRQAPASPPLRPSDLSFGS